MAQRDDHWAAGLPPALMRNVLLRLPLDSRARCACVCRSWRIAVDDPELWTRLDFQCEDDDWYLYRHRERFSHAALRVVAARAHGRLETLEVSRNCLIYGWLPALRDVVAANAVSFQQLHLCRDWTDEDDEVKDAQVREGDLPVLEEMLRTAPAMQLRAGVLECGHHVGQRLLLGRPPWDRLRVQQLNLHWKDTDNIAERDAVLVTVLPSLGHLEICGSDRENLGPWGDFVPFQQQEMDVIADAVLARGVTKLTLHACVPTPSAAPALARLLSSDTMTELTLDIRDTYYFDVSGVRMLTRASAELLASALRANSTLQHLALRKMLLFDDADAAVALLRGLVGHASLRRLDLSCNTTDHADAATIGAALGEIVGANAPALHELSLDDCHLRARALGPLMAALVRNTNLRVLSLAEHDMSLVFVNQHVVPALRANTTLRDFNLGEWSRHPDSYSEDGTVDNVCKRLARFVETREAARQAVEELDAACPGA
jgi:hypothetical protein